MDVQSISDSRSRYMKYKRIGEEFANAVTHGIGALASIVALVVLVIVSSGDGAVKVTAPGLPDSDIRKARRMMCGISRTLVIIRLSFVMAL